MSSSITEKSHEHETLIFIYLSRFYVKLATAFGGQCSPFGRGEGASSGPKGAEAPTLINTGLELINVARFARCAQWSPMSTQFASLTVSDQKSKLLRWLKRSLNFFHDLKWPPRSYLRLSRLIRSRCAVSNFIVSNDRFLKSDTNWVWPLLASEVMEVDLNMPMTSAPPWAFYMPSFTDLSWKLEKIG